MSEELTEPQKEINDLVAKAQKALEDYANFDQKKIDYIVAKASVAALDHHGNLLLKKQNAAYLKIRPQKTFLPANTL